MILGSKDPDELSENDQLSELSHCIESLGHIQLFCECHGVTAKNTKERQIVCGVTYVYILTCF